MKHHLAAALFAAITSSSMAVAQSGVIADACTDDIEVYCPDISHIRGAVQLCLGEHVAQVSTECRTALETAGPRNPRFGWGGQFRRPDYLGIRQLVAAVASLGYTDLTDIEFEGGHYELEATSSDGERVELYVDAVTGRIIHFEPDDD